MTFEDYDKLNIHCSVYFADFGFPGMWWKYGVSWYNKEGRLVKGNVGSAYTRADANVAALKIAEHIHKHGYNQEPKQPAWNRETNEFAEGTVLQY